jgi:hypothetical protein
MLRRGKETNGKEAAKKAWKLFIGHEGRPFSAGLRAEEEGVMSGKFEIYLEGGMGGGGAALSHDRTATDATCERNIYVAKAQIAHATQLEHIFVATSRATVDAPARRRSYIESTDHSESACRKNE